MAGDRAVESNEKSAGALEEAGIGCWTNNYIKWSVEDSQIVFWWAG